MHKLILRQAFLLTFGLILGLSGLHAQELQVSVSVQGPQIQSDKQILQDMQQAMSQYLNQRRWTDHKYLPHEKIKANMVVIINKRPSVDRFEGTLQLRIQRPVYNSTYETVLLNLQDKFFNVNFVQFQNLEFSENTYIDNLTSILNFYANIILGYDYDSFSMNGGSAYFQEAQKYTNLASNSRENGWQSMDGNKTRYWLSENVLNNSYRKFHNVMYVYHRQGLDMMWKDMEKARANILGALTELQKLNLQNPGLYIVPIFMDSKQQEIVNIFKGAFPHQKQKLLQIMETLDPSNQSKYQAILQGN